MANKTIDMSKLRLLLRLYGQGYGKKAISARTGIARNTVKKYLLHFLGLRLTLDQVNELSDTALDQLFSGKEQKDEIPNERYTTLEALLPDLEKRLKRKGMSL